jgi:hypothetical protein
MITDEHRRHIYQLAGCPDAQVLKQDDGSAAFRLINDYAVDAVQTMSDRGIALTIDIVKDPQVIGFATQVTETDYLVSVTTGITDMREFLAPLILIPDTGPARLATRCIAHYILAHEVAHVARGHVTEVVQPLCFNSAEGPRINEDSVMNEADADSLAGLSLSNQVLQYGGKDMPDDAQISFFLMSMQFLVEFWKRQGHGESEHPHPYARYGLLRDGMIEGYRRRGIQIDFQACEWHALDIVKRTLGDMPPADRWITTVNSEHLHWRTKYEHRMAAHTKSMYETVDRESTR